MFGQSRRERKPGPDEWRSRLREKKQNGSKERDCRRGRAEREREREKILSPNGKRWREQKPERVSEVGCEFISSVSHLEPSAARLKFHLGRADVIKTNYAYGTVMPYHFIP